MLSRAGDTKVSATFDQVVIILGEDYLRRVLNEYV